MINKIALADDELDNVNGGVLKPTGYRVLDRQYIEYAKKRGWDVNQCVNYLRRSWEEGCELRRDHSNGSFDDMEEAINYVYATYNESGGGRR